MHAAVRFEAGRIGESRDGAAAAPARGSADGAMDRYAAGDADAFGAVYAELAPVLLGFACRWTRSRALGEEAVQQTFLQMVHARPTWRPGAAVRPWAYAILRRLLTDLGRRGRHEASGGADPGAPDLPASAPSPLEALGQRRDMQATLEDLVRLPEKLRLAFELVRIEGLSGAEAAASLGITVANVKVRVHRAAQELKRLRHCRERGPPSGRAA